jgi:hypothetical protein
MFAVKIKVKLDIENIRGLNLAVAKLATVQMTKLSLLHKISKINMTCFAKPGLREVLRIVHKEEFSVTWCICEMYT